MPERMHDLTDHALRDAYERGEARAFAVLVERYQRPLFNFILRSVTTRDVAEDLLQETWVRVIQRSADFKRDSKFTTWLYTIARNLCIDHSRKMRHRKHASLDATPPDGGAALVERTDGGAPDPERSADSSDVQARVARAVEAMPEEQREVFLMRQVQCMAFAEIAVVVGVPENTAKSRMRYALERLQHELAAYRDDATATARESR
jgi:RNA polymerase sigma-70 factor (ECF subfamily)